MALRDVIERIAGEIPWRQDELDAVSELDARREFIDPILAELGWSGLKRLRREYSVGDHKRLKVDYALLGNGGNPVAFIEAKAPRENLDRHVDQVLKYADREEVDICVLTTGKRWWLYLPRRREEFDNGRFATLTLFPERPNLVLNVSKTLEETLGYKALTTGAAEGSAKQLLQKRKDEEHRKAEIPRAWNRLVNDSSTKLLDLVGEEVFQAIGQRPSLFEIRHALWDILGKTKRPTQHRRATVAQIVSAVNEVTSKSAESSDIGKQLAKDLAVYLAREHTDASFVEIASRVGVGDHTTVMNSYIRVNMRINSTHDDVRGARQIRRWHRDVCERLKLEP